MSESEIEIESINKITTPHITKFELARILGTRALQISMGADIMIDLDVDEVEPLDIAMKELLCKKMPLKIRRYLPDGSYEDCDVNELIVTQLDA